MHTHTSPHPAAATALPTYRPQTLLGRFMAALKAHRARAEKHRRAVKGFKDLLGLSDHMLADIGLTREQVVYDRLRYRLTGELPSYNV